MEQSEFAVCTGPISKLLKMKFNLRVCEVRAFFLAILLVSLSEVAIAQTECSSIPKASDRLACYDKANPPIAVGKPARAPLPQQVNSGDALAQENALLDAKIKNICRGC
jgi:hypothetical protein